MKKNKLLTPFKLGYYHFLHFLFLLPFTQSSSLLNTRTSPKKNQLLHCIAYVVVILVFELEVVVRFGVDVLNCDISVYDNIACYNIKMHVLSLAAYISLYGSQIKKS